MHDVPVCPLCGYSLRGLTEPRCPECGYTFTWEEILDPARRLHQYLFEQHPERNVRSFFRTLVGGLRPRRFWSSIYPTQPSRPRRLGLYACLVLAVYLLGVTASLSVYSVYRARHTDAMMRQHRMSLRAGMARMKARDPTGYAEKMKDDSLLAFLDRSTPVLTRRQLALKVLKEHWDFSDMLTPLIVPLVWPWAVLAGLMAFRISMRRAKIKTIHVARCLVYGFDTLAWLGVQIPLCTAIVVFWQRPGSTAALNSMAWNSGIMFLLMMALSAYRLRSAYRHYMGFDHPLATVLAAHLIAALLITLPFVGWVARFSYGMLW